jgi:hypothetical protein
MGLRTGYQGWRMLSRVKIPGRRWIPVPQPSPSTAAAPGKLAGHDIQGGRSSLHVLDACRGAAR